MPVLDQIILRLTEPQENREDAVVLGRLGFLEWLMSIPDDCDLGVEARLAYGQVAALRQAMPAVGVFCELLLEAGNQKDLLTPRSQAVATHKDARRRRPLAPRQ